MQEISSSCCADIIEIDGAFITGACGLARRRSFYFSSGLSKLFGRMSNPLRLFHSVSFESKHEIEIMYLGRAGEFLRMTLERMVIPADRHVACMVDGKSAPLHLTAREELRALYPELRAARGEQRQHVSWDGALDAVADKFAAVISEHGPDTVGFYISVQLLTEDYYVFNKLAKGLIGTNNVDTNSRLCMSSAVAGYKATLGMDAPPGCYEDIDHAQCIFIAGSNTAYAHPVVFRRIEEARKKNPALKLIVVDPRRTDTASAADLHLSILTGTDVALFNAMLHVMLWEGWCDLDYIAAHAEGFEQLKATVREYTPQHVAAIYGIAAEDIVQAARRFSQGPTLSLYYQGLNQSIHGTHKNAALINLHLATGQIGKPGAAPLSLTGQPNAMGGREVGGMANLLPGHRDLANPDHRAEVADLWGVPDVPAQPGKTAVEMFEAARRGEIKALWIACTNPAQSMPDLNRVREALEDAEFVVVQEAFQNTDTVQYADVLLPASTWGEKEGTVTDSERCISRVRQAVAAPGEARHGWQIVADFAARLAQRMGKRNALDYADTESIFNEHRATTIGRDRDIVQVFLHMHWGSQFMSGHGVNVLVGNAFDPYSKRPELKHAAVQVEKLGLPWQMVVMCHGDVLRRMSRLQLFLAGFDYAALGLYGRDEELVVLRTAHAAAVSDETLAQIDTIIGLDDEARVMNYHDTRRGISKRALMEDGKLIAVRLTGETAARDWLKEIIAQGAAAQALRPWLLAPLSAPPAGQTQRGRIVCNCLDVSEQEMQRELKNGLDLAAIQGKLKCGTQCGSCLPELKRLASETAATQAVEA